MSPLEPGKYYHIYNHANGNENLFATEGNYRFFLQKYQLHISPIAHTLSYCLMPNHFHFLIKIKSEGELVRLESFPKFQTLEKLSVDEREKQTSYFLSKQFSNLFSSYTQAYNRSQNRQGSLFMKNFRRKEITSEKYVQKLVNYIHFNPVIHGFAQQPDQWRYSSFSAILSQKETMIARDLVLEWFGDLTNFCHCHRFPFDLDGMDF